MHSPDTLWSYTLAELRVQMLRFSFNAYLLGSRFLPALSTPHFWVVLVPSWYAWVWLTQRLLSNVEEVATFIAGRPVTVCFLPPAPLPPPRPSRRRPRTRCEQVMSLWVHGHPPKLSISSLHQTHEGPFLELS